MMGIENAIHEIHDIWDEHDAAVLYLDDAPVLQIKKNELPDDELFIVLMYFITPEHKAWFTYYDLEDNIC